MRVTQDMAEKMGADYAKAWCSLEASAVAAFYAPDGRIIINEGDPSEGRDAITAMPQGFYDEFPDLVVHMDDIRSSGTHAIFRWTLEGTNTGEGGSGNRVVLSGWEYWKFSDEGLVAESAGHFDTDDFQRQLDGN